MERRASQVATVARAEGEGGADGVVMGGPAGQPGMRTPRSRATASASG